MYKIYGKPSCKFCDMSKALLDMKGIEYEYVDVSTDAEAMALLQRNNFRTVPQIYKDGEHIGGFTELRSLVG